MLTQLDSWMRRPNCIRRHGDGLWMLVTSHVLRLCIAYSGDNTVVEDHEVAGSRPQETDTIYKGPEIAEDTTDTVDSTSESIGTR
ncbi:hypothetical protein Tco_0463671 [Tanacetum coccineum]